MLVNGRAAKVSLKLKEGDVIALTVPPRRPPRLIAEDAPLVIVHEDEHVLVLDKPAGQVVHPGAGVHSGTLAHALLHHAPSVAAVGGEGRPGIVHRLDRDTSGLMVVAKSEEAYLELVESLRRRTVKRTYLALVWGDPGPSQGRVDLPLGRDSRDRRRMAVVRGPAGKPSVTHWRVLERYGLSTLIEAQLETGRTHQIRVHMTAVRHPVVGDPTYGGRVKKLLSLRPAERSLAHNLLRLLQRQALHAVGLEFAHPVTGHKLEFRSEPPADFREALERLRAFAPPPTP